MPEMDGLQLVKAVRLRYPHVPVILITGHGSETLAAEALQQGAASYVPKSQIQSLLVESINQVLELSRGEANYRRLIEHTTATEFHFELTNEEELIEPLIILVQQMVAGMDLSDAAGRLQVGVALEHAVLNAMYHGNLELTTPEVRADQARADEEGYQSVVRQRHGAGTLLRPQGVRAGDDHARRSATGGARRRRRVRRAEQAGRVADRR